MRTTRTETDSEGHPTLVLEGDYGKFDRAGGVIARFTENGELIEAALR